MSVHLPYIQASFDEFGLISNSSFTISFSPYDAESLLFMSTTEDGDYGPYVDTDWQSKKPGTTPLYFLESGLYDDVSWVYPLEVPGDRALSSPTFSDFEEGLTQASEGDLLFTYNTKITVDYQGDVTYLRDQYNKYSSDSEYSDFSNALEGITAQISSEVFDSLNRDGQMLLFKKTTQEPLGLDEISALDTTEEAATEITQVATAATYTTTAVATGGGGSY
jgi:hypothetical protein